MDKPDVSILVDVSTGTTLEQATEKYRLSEDVTTAAFQMAAVTVSFRKAVVTAVMEKAMGGDLDSILWLEERGYAAPFKPVERCSAKDESDNSDS